jgi:hypothetical protein
MASDGPSAADALDAGPSPETRPDQVRGVLRAIGRGTHALIGDERFPEHWSFTEPELDDLTPPVTALVNQSDYLRRAVHRSDYLTIAVALFGWTDRNVTLARMIAEAEPEAADDELPEEFTTDDERRPPVMDLGALDSLVRP